MELTRKIIDEITGRIDLLAGELDKSSLYAQKTELEGKMGDKDFWNDPVAASKINELFSDVTKKIELIEKLYSTKSEILSYFELYSDPTVGPKDRRNIEKEMEKLLKVIKDIEIIVKLNGKFDKKDSIITIKAGQGGTDACDWVSMLYRMYTKFVNSVGWGLQIIDEVKSEEAGYTQVVFKVIADYAYGYLKSETGVHRLVRISPFNAQGLRQTSFAGVEVMPALDKLDTKDFQIPEGEIEFKATMASGPGGQNVNKNMTAVRLTHIPTGISVRCASQRSQVQNRENAMEILKSKLLTIEEDKEESKRQNLRKDVKDAQWGNQIRNYVLHPYKLVKDLRSGIERSDVDNVLDGDLWDLVSSK
ncbi:peptide chain release factor 2 [Candidatus Dojkabacteria bacterium]|nr:peptide chain release factor 2 [Candidatus Dojkabacteria bacterium]